MLGKDDTLNRLDPATDPGRQRGLLWSGEVLSNGEKPEEPSSLPSSRILAKRRHRRGQLFLVYPRRPPRSNLDTQRASQSRKLGVETPTPLATRTRPVQCRAKDNLLAPVETKNGPHQKKGTSDDLGAISRRADRHNPRSKTGSPPHGRRPVHGDPGSPPHGRRPVHGTPDLGHPADLLDLLLAGLPTLWPAPRQIPEFHFEPHQRGNGIGRSGSQIRLHRRRFSMWNLDSAVAPSASNASATIFQAVLRRVSGNAAVI